MRIWTPWRRGVPLSRGFASRLPRTAGSPEGLESACCARLAMRPLRSLPSPAYPLGACACPPLTPRIAAMPDTLPTKPLARSHSFRGPRPMAWPMLLLAESPTAGWPFCCLDRTGARMQGAVRQTGLFLVVAGGPQDMPSGRLGYGRRAKRLTRHKWDARRGGGQVRQLGISGGLAPLSHVARQVRHLRSRTRGTSVSLVPCSGASGAG